MREAAQSLRGDERLALTVAATSLGLVTLEGASITLIVPFLQSFRPGELGRLRLIIVGVGVLLVLRSLAAWANGVLSAKLQLRVLLRLRESLAESFYRSRYADLVAMGPGRLINLFSVQTERVVGGIGALVALANALLLLAIYGTALVVLSWRASLAAALVGGVGFLVAAYAGGRIRDRAARMVEAEGDSSALALDDAAGLSMIRVYDAGRSRLALHRRVNDRVFREAMGLHRWRSAVKPLTDVLYAGAVLGALLLALTLWGTRVLDSIPLIIAFGFVLTRLQGQLGAVAEASVELAEQDGAALGVFAFLGSSAARDPDGTAELTPEVRLVQVERVTFRYGDGAPVLRGLDLELTRGEVVAVVGESGTGKSTLAQLLMRLREPQGGSIRLDGVGLDEFSRASLAKRLGVVFEDGFVFDESVEWNVSMGRDLPASAVREATDAAGLADVIAALPDGLATRVGSRGNTLSAGQRQRLALARAIAARPQILVLDEATNALDSPTETSIAEQLRALRPTGITLLIAHRLNTVLAADRILVMDGGRIAAAGRHEELLETSPAYRRLVESQLINRASPVGPT
ncbi:MAG: ABC transporter ATP-binding protein [Gemmatimonadales bacterium]